MKKNSPPPHMVQGRETNQHSLQWLEITEHLKLKTNLKPAPHKSIMEFNTQVLDLVDSRVHPLLDRNNYILWKTMVSTIIRGHMLDVFINGMRQAPPEFVPTGVATGDGQPGFGVRVKTQTNSTKRTAIVKAIDALASLGADTVTTGSSLSATWRLLWTTEKEQLFIIEKAYLFGTQAGDVLQLLMGWSNKVVLSICGDLSLLLELALGTEGFYIMERGGDDEWSAWLDYDCDDGPSLPEGSSVDPEQPSVEEGSGDPEEQTQKNTRGRSKRNDITKMVSEGKKMEIEYNHYGQHWGTGGTAKVTRIGAWVRTNIPLRDITWPKVSQDLKNQLWEHIKVAFDVPDTDKRMTIAKGGDRWKDWKSTLTEEWREFVDSRLSPEFGVKRKRAQESRACNLYPHRTGRGGVRMIQEQMEKEVGHQITEFDRSEIWKRSRTKSNGEVEGPTAEVVKRILKSHFCEMTPRLKMNCRGLDY
ncbi:hypothetical protein F8388_019678 [Cannabis sativa]|uniref:Plastid lipid-associated protein/fibrillin conserved domain-containing protein n=1 Tax=Cannabis sativa TaxID=3483 RepID=A0A7J6FGM3_CANSA|nr:hypothetical protein F8388_019678 [Cannabis sativa]